jgi:hypothetical protein
MTNAMGSSPEQVFTLLHAEIARLKAIVNGTERREAEYLALIEKISITRDTAVNMKLERDAEVERLKRRIYTLEGLLGEANIPVPDVLG